MNYIKQVNTFYKLLSSNPLSSNAQCLYNYLLNKNNELGWAKEFTISNMIVCGFTGLSRQALDRARNELKTKGYIDYKKGVSNQAGKYLIVSFVTQDDTQNDTQDNTQGGYTVTTLNKHKLNKKKKEKNNKKKKTYEDVFDEKGINENTKKALMDFIDMRKTIKKPLTSRALELQINNLEKIAKTEEDKIKIIETSIEKCWQSFYPLNQNMDSEKPKKKLRKQTSQADYTQREYEDGELDFLVSN